ncbi:methyltransferase family protein [Pseudoalteromonas sp. SSDWG2]|uniref:methyltransferase family protein n=1 Tax=Pseudoalteromonas sp. SSDWG2 TaxID=3139391 RepID=UPI003BACE053
MLRLRIPPLILVLLVAWAMFLTAFKVPIALVDVPLRELISAVSALSGCGCAVLGVMQCHRAQTTVDPRIPEQTSQLVTTGIYQYSRNPMYVGFLLILVGWGIFLSNYAALVWLPVFVLYLNTQQIKPEEEALLSKFQDEYSKYCKKVRRWI